MKRNSIFKEIGFYLFKERKNGFSDESLFLYSRMSEIKSIFVSEKTMQIQVLKNESGNVDS
jgi:hypothetical protein